MISPTTRLSLTRISATMLVLILAILHVRDPAIAAGAGRGFQMELLMDQCDAQYLKLMKPAHVSVNLLWGIDTLCYAHVHHAAALEDYDIRRMTFPQHRLESGILMWLVVAITVSGVVLAGWQLWLAYRHSSSSNSSNCGNESVAGRLAGEQGANMVFEGDKISIRSSVTGIIILALSLMFFLIYVKYIWPIKEIPDENAYAYPPSELNAALSTDSPSPPDAMGPFLGIGGIGSFGSHSTGQRLLHGKGGRVPQQERGGQRQPTKQ